MIIGIMLGVIGITDIRADASNIHALSISGYPKGNNNCELMYDRIALTELSGYYANAYVQKYTYNSEKTASSGGSTAATMDRKIADVLQNSSRNDIMIFYYYGHSVSDGEGSSLGLALNAVDGYCNEWYTWDRLARNLASFPGNIYVILDTCHSEDFWTKGVRSLTNSDAQERFSCLLACGANETSKYGPKLLFTTPTKLVDAKYYGSFIFNIGKGLGFWNGVSAADNNSNGYVTINELYTYVQQHISGFDKMTVKKYGSHLNDPLFHYSVHFNYSNLTMVVKEKKTLEAYVTGSKVPAKWSSSNSSVATVNSKGKITAKKAGTTIITAEINGSRTTCKVTVKSKESIKLNKTSATVNKGSSITLKATVTGLSKKVTWATSDKKIATVKNGKVTGKKAGKVTITAKANGKTAKCKVTVKERDMPTKRVSEVSNVAKMTAPNAAKSLGLNKIVTSGRTIFYTRNGKTGDGSSYMHCSVIDKNDKGMWTLYADDTTISVYGAKVGMSRTNAHNALVDRGWKKTSDITNSVMKTVTLGYDKGDYHIVVLLKGGKVTSISYYNLYHSW